MYRFPVYLLRESSQTFLSLTLTLSVSPNTSLLLAVYLTPVVSLPLSLGSWRAAKRSFHSSDPQRLLIDRLVSHSLFSHEEDAGSVTIPLDRWERVSCAQGSSHTYTLPHTPFRHLSHTFGVTCTVARIDSLCHSPVNSSLVPLRNVCSAEMRGVERRRLAPLSQKRLPHPWEDPVFVEIAPTVR